MSSYSSPTDVAPVTRALSAQLNDLDAAVAAAFALLPDETKLKLGTVQYAVDTGTVVNEYLVALPHTPSGYTDGMRVTFKPILTNTGAATIDVNGLGAKSIRQYNGAVLGASDIVQGAPVDLMYSSTTGYFHRTGSGPAGATGATGPTGSISSAPNGSLAAPSIAFTAEATGFYLAAAGKLGISVAGVWGGQIGSAMTAIGLRALDSNTTGANNIAFGADALTANTDGSNNVAIGYQALDANVSGTNNIAVGASAAGATTNGQGNIAVGATSLSANTVGNNNTVVGTSSVPLGTGSNNVAIGAASLVGLSTGSRNTALGTDVSTSDGTVSDSTGLGYGAPITKSFQFVLGNASVTEYHLPGTAAHFKYLGSFSSSAPRTVTAATDSPGVADSSIIANRAGTVTLTLPAPATYPGRHLWVRTIQAQTVVSASANVVPQAGGAAQTGILAASAGKWALLVSDGTNWHIQASN